MAVEPRSDEQSPVDVGRLELYLRQIPELRDYLPVHSLERIGGGQSNLTFRVHLAEGSVILRRPPTGPLPPKAHDVVRESRVMRALAASDVPVPRVIAVGEDPSVLGSPFFLMEDLPGDAIRYSLPADFAADPGQPASIAWQTVDVLAILHGLDPESIGLGRLSRPAGYISRQVALWKGQLDFARVRPVPDLDRISVWLEQHLPPDVDRPSLVHGDFKLDNLIFTVNAPARLLGVVDWEMAALGDPGADLGWLLAFWCENGAPPRELTIMPRTTELPAFPRRQELAARYAERTGRNLPQLHFYVVLALWKMAILLEAHWARHVRGTAGAFSFSYLESGGPIFHTYIRETMERGAGL